MTRQQDPYHEWDASQWAGVATDELRAPQAEHDRWNKFEWVGDQGRPRTDAWRRPQDMPEGDAGLSGFRHNPGVQHWAERGAI